MSGGTSAMIEDAKAKDAMARIHAAFAGRDDVVGIEFKQLVDKADPAWGVAEAQLETYRGELTQRGQLDLTFGDVLFTMKKPGTVSAPFRTKWGWDIVLLDTIWPEETTPKSKILTDIFPELQRQHFVTWVRSLAAAAGTTVTIHDDVLARTSHLGVTPWAK
ncbi:MAG: peptidylprolyl isomerase [Myxococcales bacterium]|nr:peptidylprolyl isomerase [Myxococcales bacterium]